MTDFIIVLGAPNDDRGQLLPAARARCDTAYSHYLADPTQKIFCTGGFGPGFNRTERLHAAYAKAYLMAKGVPESAIAALVPSRFTIEDATLSWQILKEIGLPIEQVTVITSDFHLPRVQMIFTHIFVGIELRFVGVETSVDAAELARLVAHEQIAMERDRQNLRALGNFEG